MASPPTGEHIFHPLLRTLAYTEASLTQQREAHLALAESLLLDTSCRAWHLAAATSGPDESIATALEQSAHLSQRRGGYLQVARALHRAAELSPQPGDAARRYAEAAAAANFGGDPAWALVSASTRPCWPPTPTSSDTRH